jgi:hypothetical protein
MALDNYSNLKASIVRWTGRNDLSASFDDFIQLAEEKMFSSEVGNPLRSRFMETRVTATLPDGDRFIQLPDNFLEQRRIKFDLSGERDKEISFVVPGRMQVQDYTGRPRYFTVTSQFEFDCAADQNYTIEVQYYKKPAALSDSNPTNEVLTNHPSIYLHGALMGAYDFAEDWDLSAQEQAKFYAAIAGANNKDEWARFGPAPAVRYRRGVV